MTIRKFIQKTLKLQSNTELQEVQRLINATENYISSINENSTNKLERNHELIFLSGIIQHLENNYTQIPDCIYEKILKCNSGVKKKSFENFRKEYSC
ncbi:MAG TPA: hypothetical protein VGA21_14635 [Cyclobacteriaceae bacterium]|jgi:exoribonuclease R